nr:MAG TPA: hypothetical protein [Caudoviricetes sp.]
MKLKYIVAVECKNLTEQDEIRLYDMDGSEYVNEQLFKGHLKDSIADREGKVNVVMGTFADWVRHVRGNEDFEPRDYVIIKQIQ